MSTYVSICEHMLTYINICKSHMLTFVDICWHMLTNVNKFQSKVFHCISDYLFSFSSADDE
jgi:hypothetical protein